VNFSTGFVVDSQDVVTQVPPQSAGYRHIGNLVRLDDDGARFIPRTDSRSAFAAGSTAVASMTDERDPVNRNIEGLRGVALKEYMKTVSLLQMERAPQSGSAVRTASAGAIPSSAFAMSLATLPSFKFHLSGEYLRRTGLSLLTQP
jgi:hypothetical protein